METFAPASACRHTTLRLTTARRTEFVDLTDQVEAFICEAGVQFGIMNIQTLHTTTAIVVNEHEPLLLSDFCTLLARAAPRAAFYRHDDLQTRTVNLQDGERSNGHAHCRALLLGGSASLNVINGRLQRGRWQRIFLVELDGPRTRDVSLLLLGEGAG